MLIVEDEEVMAATLGSWISKFGYRVTHARNAKQGLDAMKEEPADVGLVDVGLPGEHDGLWLADELRRHYPETALILSTGMDYLPASATMRPGVVSYLLKPFRHHQLREAIAASVCWHDRAVSTREATLALLRAARDRRFQMQERMRRATVTSEDMALRLIDEVCDRPSERERSERVATRALAISNRFLMRAEERDAIYWAGRFHWLCRLTTPDSVLTKAEPLSHVEVAVLHRGPSYAFEMLKDHPFLQAAGTLLHSVCEREDGLGEPQGLVGDAIPLGSRILSVVDAIETMLSGGPSRPALSTAAAAAELRRGAGWQFDPSVVDRAISVMD